ncbi:MAG: hypothetical protein AAF927_06160 [Bacteroidota bacterium]
MCRITILCLSLILLGSTSFLSAQELLSSLPLKNPPNKDGLYFPYQNENGAEHMILYAYSFSLRVLYLDADFNLLEDVSVFQEDNSFKSFKIVSFIDQSDHLLLLVEMESESGFTGMVYDKAERSLKRTGLRIPTGYGSLYSNPSVHEGDFLILEIPLTGSEIMVHRSRDGYTLQTDRFQTGIKNLNGVFELPDSRLLFPITTETGNNFYSNLSLAKLYLYGPHLHLSVEDHQAGTMQLISIHLDEKTLREMQYQFGDSTATNPNGQYNSLLYEDLILLASYEAGMGLKLDVYEFGFAQASQRYKFAADLSMDPFFLASEAERTDGESLAERNDLHAFLPKSLILSLEPTSEGDLWLIIGSLKQMSEGARNAIIAMTEITTLIVGMAVDPISLSSNMFVSPAAGVGMGSNMILNIAEQNSKFVYRVGVLRAQDLQLEPKSQIRVVLQEAKLGEAETPAGKMSDFLMLDKEFRPKSGAQVMFSYQEGIVRGYVTRKKVLKLYYFE